MRCRRSARRPSSPSSPMCLRRQRAATRAPKASTRWGLPTRYCVVLSCVVLYCSAMCCVALGCTILHCTILQYYIVLCSFVWVCVVLCCVLMCSTNHLLVLFRMLLLFRRRRLGNQRPSGMLAARTHATGSNQVMINAVDACRALSLAVPELGDKVLETVLKVPA